MRNREGDKKMLKINIVFFDELTDNEQAIQPNNGRGKEYASYIKITDGAETLMLLSDAVEAEDARFTRDFNCIVDALEQVYLKGLQDGKKLRN